MSFHNSSFALRYFLMKMARPQCDTPPCYLFIYLFFNAEPRCLSFCKYWTSQRIPTWQPWWCAPCLSARNLMCVQARLAAIRHVWPHWRTWDNLCTPVWALRTFPTSAPSTAPPFLQVPAPAPTTHSFHLMNQHLVTAYFANKWLVAILALSLNWHP